MVVTLEKSVHCKSAAGRQCRADVAGDMSADDLFYVELDDKQRPWRVRRHAVGSMQHDDVTIYQENDETSWVEIRESTSKDVLFICSSSLRSSLVLAYPLSPHASQLWARQDNVSRQGAAVTAAAAEGWPLMTVVERKQEEIAAVDHFRAPAEHAGQDQWVILMKTSSANNGHILVAPLQRPLERAPLVEHSEDVCLENLVVYANFVAVLGRQEGFQQVWLLPAPHLARCLVHASGRGRRRGQAGEAARGGRGSVGAGDIAEDVTEVVMHRIKSSEEVYVIGLPQRPCEYETRRLRFTYSSPICPPLTCECEIPERVPTREGGGGESGRRCLQGSGGRSVEDLQQTPQLWLEMHESKVVCLCVCVCVLVCRPSVRFL